MIIPRTGKNSPFSRKKRSKNLLFFLCFKEGQKVQIFCRGKIRYVVPAFTRRITLSWDQSIPLTRQRD